MTYFFKKTFLKDLSGLPDVYRTKIEKLIFEVIPATKNITDKLDIKKIEGHKNYYRIRIGNYRIGCEIQAGDKIIFYRVKHRKDIYRIFP